MTKAMLIAAALLVAGMTWMLRSNDRPTLMTALLASARAAVGDPAGAGGAAAPSAGSDGTSPSTASGAATGGGPSNTPAMTGIRLAELGMTRQLAGDHRLEMGSRPHRVLGSKEVTDPQGKSETLLLVHDELSGQVRYFLPGLQFTLAPGIDAEAYIREHPRQQRRFVNPLYVQVAVDGADIAAEYTALLRDSRVASLRFMTPEPWHRER